MLSRRKEIFALSRVRRREAVRYESNAARNTPCCSMAHAPAHVHDIVETESAAQDIFAKGR